MLNHNFFKCMRISVIAVMLCGFAVIHCSCMSAAKQKHELIRAKDEIKDDANTVLGVHPYSLF
ncbi:MAG: hypothetical protein RBU23_11345 [Candidatus Auribacterota bacterium]|nr:hypothetical protein [Candidatus Auribacterota bacterium]